jgi:subtilisin family serine protease
VTPGQIVQNSSWGPTRDGRIKPDISAPGSSTLSAGQLSLMAIWQTQPSNVVKIAEGGFHFRDGGTSSSSPVVAGVAALLLQQNSSATAIQVKNAITQCAVQDSFTGFNLPDNIWGYGKVDAFNTLTACALNTSVQNLNQNNNIYIYPNPVRTGENIMVTFNPSVALHKKMICLSDYTGRIILKSFVKEPGLFSLSTKKLVQGIYFVSVSVNDQVIKTEKITVID